MTVSNTNADTTYYSYVREVLNEVNSQSEFKLVDDIFFDEANYNYEYHAYVASYQSSNDGYRIVYKLAF